MQKKSLFHACVEKIPLQDVEVEEFRKVKNVDCLVTHKYHGIKELIYGLKKHAMIEYIVLQQSP